MPGTDNSNPQGSAPARPGLSSSGDTRAAEEAPPREVEAGAGTDRPVDSPGAVDENRPADVVAQAGLSGLSGARVAPNVLQRQHVIVPEDRVHPETPGQAIVDAE